MLMVSRRYRRVERATLRREGNLIYTILVCHCGRSMKFSAVFDETNDSPRNLYKPIDKINKDIKSSGWIEAMPAPFDLCPSCRKKYPYMKPRKDKRKGELEYED